MADAEVKTMKLPVALREAEVAVRSQELAAAEGVLSDAEERLDAFNEAAKGTRKQIETEIGDARSDVRRLAGVVRSKKEIRDVTVVEEFDFESSAVHTVRADTREVVATRGMTTEERQRSLFRDVKAGGQES